MKNYTNWHHNANAKIAEVVETFYPGHYQYNNQPVVVEPIGSSYRVQPCPFCGHQDCFTITPGVAGAKCFSAECEVHGNHVSLALQYGRLKNQSEVEVLQELADDIQLPLPENLDQVLRAQAIRRDFAELCHQELMANSEALKYQTEVRKHQVESLVALQVGLTPEFSRVKQSLAEKGYKDTEIDQVLEYIPEGLIIYPYRDSFYGEIIRYNTKNPFGKTYPDGNVIKGLSSRDPKTWYAATKADSDQVTLAEGENDGISLREAGATSVLASGGSISDEQLADLERYSKIYCAPDNDSAGDAWFERIVQAMPHKLIYRIRYDEQYKDPDEYFKSSDNPTTIEELLEKAELVESTGHKITHKGHTWSIRTRCQCLEYEVASRNSKSGEFKGTVKYYENGEPKDWDHGKSLAKYKDKRAKRLTLPLFGAICDFYDGNMANRSFDDLLLAYKFSFSKEKLTRALAEKVREENMSEKLVDRILAEVGTDLTDAVLKEVNELDNGQVKDLLFIPKIRLGQHFDPPANRAYYYFTKVNSESGNLRKLPYLLTNDKRQIRLDLFKRKDEQSLILIDGRYELQFEVPVAPYESDGISLSQEWVDKWVNGEVSPEQLDPQLLVQQIESVIRRFYYSDNDLVYKAMALWIYGTYYYELLGVYPYIFLNGTPGSGKSTAAEVGSLLEFNGIFTTDITDASLFRLITQGGCCLNIDEAEHMASGKKNGESNMGIINSGYSKGAKTHRTNMEKGGIVDEYEVFCPKIICNIRGMDTVTLDRCLVLNSYECPPEMRARLENPQVFKTEEAGYIKQLTSRCALSALEHFQQVYSIYRKTKLSAMTARLAQILTPLAAIAEFVGGDYPEFLREYNETMVKQIKLEIERNTPTGIVKSILREVVLELIGIRTPNLTTTEPLPKCPVGIESANNSFKITDLKLKVLIEEARPGEKVLMEDVNKWMKMVLSPDIYKLRKRTSTIISEESLIREFNNNTKVNIYEYPINFDRIVPDYSRLKAQAAANTAQEELSSQEEQPSGVEEFLKDDETFEPSSTLKVASTPQSE